MIKAAQVRDAARKAREAARKGKGARQERILSGKLAPAQTKNKKKKRGVSDDVANISFFRIRIKD